MPKEKIPGCHTGVKTRNGCPSVHHHAPTHTPSRFRRTPKTQTGRARRAFAPNGPGSRLMSALGSAVHLFTLTPADLGLPASYSDPSVLYDPVLLGYVFKALERAFSGPLFGACEVGTGTGPERGKLHVHAIAHRNDGPAHIKRDTVRCKPVYDAPGAYRYLHKPAEPYSLEAHLDHAAAKVVNPSGKAPRTRRHFLGPQRLGWRGLNATNDLTLPPAPQPTRDDTPPKLPERTPAPVATGYPTRTRGDPAATRTTSTRPLRTWRQTRAPCGDKHRAAAPAPARPVYATRERPCTPRSAAPATWQPNVRPLAVGST
jgi:hypothetical protein